MADTVAQAKTIKDQFPWQTGDRLLENLRNLMTVLDAQIQPLIASKADYDDATTQIRNVILQRFNEQIQPIFDEIVSAAQLGVIFTSTSLSPGDNTIGLKAFYLQEPDKTRFAAAAYLSAFSADGLAGVSGLLRSYDRGTGLLLIDAISSFGTPNTQIASWIITAGADSQALRSYVDASIASAVATAVQQIEGGATTALDTLGEAEARIKAAEARLVAIVGSADQYGDTLGELQATAAANLAASKAYAKRQSIIFG